MPSAPSKFLRWSATTATALVLALVFIGGLVRATGAGLGCPDWPRCWGSWWPPASPAEISLERINRDKIPAEYRQAPDPRVFFNHRKMWIEYLNRVWGVLTGLSILVLFVAAARQARGLPLVFSGASASLVLVLLQGWLGALVVRSGLKQHMVTLHMALALAILALVVFTAFHARGACLRCSGIQPSVRRQLKLAAGILLVVLVVQILAGTEVRSSLDAVAANRPDLPRGDWISLTGWIDHAHRLFSWAVLAASLWSFLYSWKWMPALRRQTSGILALVILQLALGVSLVHFGLPPVSQVVHLGIAASLAAAVFRLLLDLHTRPLAAPPA